MEINISLLEKYIELNGFEANINVLANDKSGALRIVRGKYEDNSNTAIYLEPCEFLEILEANGIIERLRLILDTESEDRVDREKIRQALIYGTLAKYIIQMLNATLGEILFIDITPLPRHKVAGYFQGGDD